MGISLFGKNNERLAQGLNYDNFTTLATSATDRFRKGGPIDDRTIRLTKDGKGIATTTFSGTTGARVGQIADARKAFLDAVERKFGLNARAKAAGMLKEDGADKPPPRASSKRSTTRSTHTRGRSARTVSSPHSAAFSSARSRTPWSPWLRSIPARRSTWPPCRSKPK